MVYGTLNSGQTYQSVTDFFGELDHGMIGKNKFYAIERAVGEATGKVLRHKVMNK